MVKLKTIDILIVISVLLAIVFFLWWVFGESPALEQIVLTIILPMYGFTFGIYKHLNDRINNKFEKLNNKLNEKFEKLNEKLSFLGERLARIEGKLNRK